MQKAIVIRNDGVELYRVLLMFGICWLHAITQGKHCIIPFNGRISYLLLACVPGFLFISGWYGVRLKISKLLLLWGQALYCALVLILLISLGCLSDIGSPVRDILRDNWFLAGYTVMMLLAPMVDLSVDGLLDEDPCRRRRSMVAVVGLLVLVFGWGGLLAAPRLGDYIPHSLGLQPWTGLCCLGIYAAARVVRKLDLAEFLTVSRRMMLAVLSVLAIIGAHLSHYSSPFPVVLAAVCFLSFEKLHMPIAMGRIIRSLGPSLFSVFLLHNTQVGFAVLSKVNAYFLGKGAPCVLAPVLTALIVFFGGCILDAPRRILVAICRRTIGGKYGASHTH